MVRWPAWLRSSSDVGAVDPRDHLAAEIGEAGIGALEAAVAGEVALVVGELHHPDAERRERVDPGRIALERGRVLEIVDEAELAGGARGADVGGALDLGEQGRDGRRSAGPSRRSPRPTRDSGRRRCRPAPTVALIRSMPPLADRVDQPLGSARSGRARARRSRPARPARRHRRRRRRGRAAAAF